MIERTIFSDGHKQFRDSFRKFLEKEVLPFHAEWEEQGFVDRKLWSRAGEAGFLCPSMPEEYGGSGADRLYSVVMMEEIARANTTGIGFGLHSEIVAPYILHYGSEEQKKRYLPAMARGEIVGAIAMSEPAAGSDLQGIQTTAVKEAGGAGYVVNGSKTFVTNGWHADLVITVAKTNPAAGAKGTSLLILERNMPGFEKGQRLKKVGMKAQDTSELFMNDVRVPRANLLGEENQGFVYLMKELPWERLQIAIAAVAGAQAAIEWTVEYVRSRKVFGTTVSTFQNTRFTLAEVQTEVQIARVFVDRCIELILEEKLDTATASMAKYWCTDLQGKVVDECVQLHGGYGYMWEYPIARAYADARVQRIYGGTNEIMKELITRSMGLGGK
ncbi:MAG TPA: acyl-CoA dehydrogenase family protein [Polyangiaceae bacterium]